MQKISLIKKNFVSFSSVVNIDGKTKKIYFTQKYNSILDFWTLQAKTENESLISFPLIPCGGNLLKNFSYKKMGSAWLFPLTENAKGYPGWNDLDDWLLLWGDTDE